MTKVCAAAWRSAAPGVALHLLQGAVCLLRAISEACKVE